MSVDEEESGTGHIQELARRLGIQYLVGANDLGIRIGEQRKIDFAAIGERFQYGFRVVADRRELDPSFLEPCFGILELNQLPFAVGSPIRRSKEEQHCTARSLQTFQRLLVSKLI